MAETEIHNEIKDIQFRFTLIRGTGFRIAALICGKDPRSLSKDERKQVGRLTEKFIAKCRDDGMTPEQLFLLSWLNPEGLNDYLDPKEWYKSIGITL